MGTKSLPTTVVDTVLTLIPRDPKCHSNSWMKVVAYSVQVMVKVLAHILITVDPIGLEINSPICKCIIEIIMLENWQNPHISTLT